LLLAVYGVVAADPPSLTYQDILDPSSSNHESFQGESLVYVTPWNSHGYDVAKTHASKFTFISPVWFNIQPTKGGKSKFKISGGHDVDASWVQEVRKNGGINPPKIVPRFSADGFQQQDFASLATNPVTSKNGGEAHRRRDQEIRF